MNKLELLTINEACKYLGVKKSTLYSWSFQKKIPHVKVGKLLKFEISQLNEWLRQNMQGVVN
jgi:excisionase family DNA binding protein